MLHWFAACSFRGIACAGFCGVSAARQGRRPGNLLSLSGKLGVYGFEFEQAAIRA
jgi:hypothetical protein